MAAAGEPGREDDAVVRPDLAEMDEAAAPLLQAAHEVAAQLAQRDLAYSTLAGNELAAMLLARAQLLARRPGAQLE